MEIPDNKLFRIVTLPAGNFKGKHRIYWNAYICNLYETAPIFKWDTKECHNAVVGDWIDTLDGTVMQILDIRDHPSKNNKRVHRFYRFCTATVYSWTRQKDDLIQYRRLQGNFMTASNHSLKMTTKSGSQNQKLRFAAYIVSGINPLKAFRLAFSYYQTDTITTLHRKVNTMINDDIVKKEILIQSEPLIDEISEAFPNNRFVTELNELLTHSKKGSKDHRDNILLIMDLLGKLPSRLSTNKPNPKDTDEVPYDEVSIPQIEPAAPSDKPDK